MQSFVRGISFVTEAKNLKIKSRKVRQALLVAEEIHKRDFRKNGAPWITHPIAVTSILASLGAGEEILAAALLHDTVEDHPKLISLADIEKKFGKRVSFLVGGVTKEEIMTNKMIEDFATSKKVAKTGVIDFGVALIKLADRYHNLTTLYALKKDRQKEFATESLSFHVPLARAFGLWDFGNFIADEAFKYFDPKNFSEIKKEIDRDPRLKSIFINRWKGRLAGLLRRLSLPGKIVVLPGGYWELAEKRRTSSMRADVLPKGFKDISDLVSFRVIVSRIDDVYRFAGEVMKEFREQMIHSRTDDCIAHPADNGYKALHLTLNDRTGIFEIAIATEAMEEYNRRGVLSQTDRKESERILVFTPKRELFFLPQGARVVDLAYKLNPTLGMQMIGARVDGKLAMPEDRLVSGTQVEVVRAGHVVEAPNKKFLKIALPETARKIRLQLRQVERQKLIKKGKRYLEKVFSKFGLLTISDLDKLTELRILTPLGCENLDQLFFKAGYAAQRYTAEVERIMEELLIRERDLTSLAIEGDSDKRGLSVKLREIIKECGGNIVHSIERVDPNGAFRIRVVMTGTKSDKELRTRLKKIKQFGKIIVV